MEHQVFRDLGAYSGQNECIMRLYALALLVLSCSASTPMRVSQALCALEAVRGLPRDPDAVTLGQAKETARSLRDCERADAGAR